MGTPPGQQPPPGQAPPGYGYNQPPQQWAGSAPPAAWNPGPAMHTRPMNWDMISFALRAIGVLLLALGAILIVATVSVPGSCFSSGQTCTTNPATYLQGAANGLMWGKIIFLVGALLLGMGAGVKLHWVLRPPTTGHAEDMAWTIVERFFNYALVAISIGLFYLLLVGFPAASLGAIP